MTLFVCNPEAAYIAQLEADHARAEIDRERDADLEHEDDLAREHLEDGGDDWPWFADDPHVVSYPEIFAGSAVDLDIPLSDADAEECDEDLCQ